MVEFGGPRPTDGEPPGGDGPVCVDDLDRTLRLGTYPMDRRLREELLYGDPAAPDQENPAGPE